MAFDSGFCRAVANELNGLITDSKVERINVPSADRVVLSLYIAGRKKKDSCLVISSSPSAPMVALGSEESENPSVPSGFCMLLRKHLTSARVTEVRQIGFERIIAIGFEHRNDLGYGERKYLYAEKMGKYSNLFLLGGDMKILGCLKSTDITVGKRLTLPGSMYEMPPVQNKDNTPDVTPERFRALAAAAADREADRFLVSSFTGIAPLTAREIAFRAGGRTDTPVSACSVALEREFFAFTKYLSDGSFTPCCVRDAQGVPFEYAFFDITQYGDMQVAICGSFSALQNAVCAEKGVSLSVKSKKRDLSSMLATSINHAKRKYAARLEDLESTSDMDEIRKKGELITSYIYMLRQGQSTAVLTDYGTGEDVKIELDSRLSPSQNAQRYFRLYRKKVSTKKNMTEQTKATSQEILYLESVADLLDRAQTEREIEDIRDELALNGYVSQSRQHRNVRKTKKSEPLLFTTSGGYTVRVGKNNIQNDSLTFSSAKDDIWFHVKNIPGSHTVMYADGEEPSAGDYTQAAVIAAYHSSGKESDVVAVDYTRRRNVRKPAGSKPGFVTYDNYFTAYVKPSDFETMFGEGGGK